MPGSRPDISFVLAENPFVPVQEKVWVAVPPEKDILIDPSPAP